MDVIIQEIFQMTKCFYCHLDGREENLFSLYGLVEDNAQLSFDDIMGKIVSAKNKVGSIYGEFEILDKDLADRKVLHGKKVFNLLAKRIKK